MVLEQIVSKFLSPSPNSTYFLEVVFHLNHSPWLHLVSRRCLSPEPSLILGESWDFHSPFPKVIAEIYLNSILN